MYFTMLVDQRAASDLGGVRCSHQVYVKIAERSLDVRSRDSAFEFIDRPRDDVFRAQLLAH